MNHHIVFVHIARSRRGLDAEGPPPTAISPRTAFLSNVAVGTFHPKTIVFFVAFAPQFIRPDVNYALQAVTLIATFAPVPFIGAAMLGFVRSRRTR